MIWTPKQDNFGYHDMIGYIYKVWNIIWELHSTFHIILQRKSERRTAVRLPDIEAPITLERIAEECDKVIDDKM